MFISKVKKIISKYYFYNSIFLVLRYLTYGSYIYNKVVKSVNAKEKIDPSDYEYRVLSQNTEDGILLSIVTKLNNIKPYIVEFGVEDAKVCNSRYLVKKLNWSYLYMDGGDHKRPYLEIKKEFITAENINDLFKKYEVPESLGILSIDIDYNTYWVLKAINLNHFKPSVIVLEYNSSLGSEKSLAVPYNSSRMWDGTNYFSASLKAFDDYLELKDYKLVACDRKGINAFYVRKEYLINFVTKPLDEVFKEPNYGVKINNKRIGHPQSKELFVEV